MGKSLQEIEDYYVNQGLVGAELRQAIENDGGYKELLARKKSKLKQRVHISDDEAKKYVLSTDADYEILAKIRELEMENLSAADKETVEFISTQLELDWRSPILAKLDKLLKKYKL